MANNIYKSALNWVKTSEMFTRQVKRIPGKWQMIEYYFDGEEDLIHIRENSLKERQEIFNIDFSDDNQYSVNCNINISLLEGLVNGQWKNNRNFISLSSLHENELEFQFAIEKDQLKLLKKDAKGRIEFFGFFKRIA